MGANQPNGWVGPNTWGRANVNFLPQTPSVSVGNGWYQQTMLYRGKVSNVYLIQLTHFDYGRNQWYGTWTVYACAYL